MCCQEVNTNAQIRKKLKTNSNSNAKLCVWLINSYFLGVYVALETDQRINSRALPLECCKMYSIYDWVLV